MADKNLNPQEITNPLAIKSIFVPQDLSTLPAILAYYQRFLEPFRSSFPGQSEQKEIFLVFKTASNTIVDKQKSGAIFTQKNRQTSFDDQRTEESFIYPTDLASILDQIYRHLQILFQDKGGLELSSFSTPLLDLFVEEINGQRVGLKESNLYDAPSARSTLEKQIKELLQTLDANLITGTDVVFSSLVDDFGSVQNQSSSNLLKFLQDTGVPLLDAVIKVPLQAETSNDELKRQVLFNQKTYSLKEAREYINALVVVINRSLTIDRPQNEKLSKLREKINVSGEFFVKNNQLIKKLAPSEKRLAYMSVDGSEEDSVREFITLDEYHLFFTPVDAPMSAEDRKNAQLLEELWKSLLELTSKNLELAKEAAPTEKDEDTDDGGVEEDEPTLGREITYNELISLFAITSADQIYTFISSSSQINLQTRIDTWLNQYGYGDINQIQLQAYLSQNLVQLVTSTFDELAKRDSSSAAAKLKNTEVSFYVSAKNVFVLNEAYEEWFQEAYDQVAQPVTELFLSEDFENKTLPAYIVLQVSPDVENTKIYGTPIESLATAGTPDQDTLAKLLKEYQASYGQSPTSIDDWATKLASLKSSNSQSYNQFIGKIITPQSRLNAEIIARMEQSVLLQLQRNGLFDVRDLSAIPDNFLATLQSDISDYLLSLPPEKLLAALADPTARLQLLSEFNRRYLLRQVSSAQVIHNFILVRQVVTQENAETELDTIIETIGGSGNSLAQKEDLKKRLHAIIIASGYTPTDADLAALDQSQIELLFDISFGDRKLSQAELDAFKNALKSYTDRYYFASQLDKEVSLSEAINEQFSGNNKKFEQEKLESLTKIATTINSFTEGKISVSATDIEKSVSTFISEASIKSSAEIEALSKQDVIRILGLHTLFDAETLERLLLELDDNELLILKQLLREYSQKFVRSFVENKAVSYITRPIAVGTSPDKKLSKLTGEDAENHGLLLSSLGEDLPERTQLTDIEKARRDHAWRAYLESLENQRVAIENGDLLPQTWQWDVPLEEIAQYSNLFPELQQRAILEKQAIAELQQQQQTPTMASVVEASADTPSAKRKIKLPFRKKDKKKKKNRIKKAIQNKIQKKVGQKIAYMVAQAIAKLIAFVVQVALPAIVAGGIAIIGAIVGSPILLGIAVGVGIYSGLNYFLPGWQASIQSFFSGIGSGLQSFTSGIGSGLQSLGSTIASGLQSAANSIIGFGQSLATSFANGALSAFQGLFQSLGSGIFSNLAIPTFSVLGAVVVPMAIMHTIDSGRFVISTQVDDVEETSQFLEITKEVTPSVMDNGQVADLQYTISLRAKGSYTVTPDVGSAKDEFTITTGTVNVDMPDQTTTVQSQLAGITIGAEPVIITYTISGVSGEDAMINNLFSLNFTANGGDLSAPKSESFQARASVIIGTPELGCFIFADETGPSNRDVTGYNRIKAQSAAAEGTPIVMQNWTEEESNEVLRAFANRMGGYDSFVSSLCTGTPISVYRVTGRSWGGWALSGNSIALYDAAFSRFSALEYTLAHELGHIYDYRNSGIEREFVQAAGSQCPVTYPLDNCPAGEPFAESIALFIVWETASFGERNGQTIGKFNFPVQLPTHYEFVRDRIFQAN
jgi:hypothetical protein